METKTIRQLINEMTNGVDTMAKLDAVAPKVFSAIKSAFPGADKGEVVYEWQSRKLRISKMVDED